MPGGTRLAALMALTLVVCLVAWRANSFLTDTSAGNAAMSPQQVQLANLIEPVLGRDAVRVATRTDADGKQNFLIMVDAPENRFHLDAETTTRIETILDAAAGYDRTRDRLQIQPFSFAHGTTGGFQPVELVELCGLSVLGILIGYLGFFSRPLPAATMPSTASSRPAAEHPPVLHAIPTSEHVANEDRTAEARRLALENPKETARVLKTWMTSQGGHG